VGIADKVWLEAVGREPGENSPWYRWHVLAQRPKLATETLIPQEWLNLALSEATAAAVQALRAGAPLDLEHVEPIIRHHVGEALHALRSHLLQESLERFHQVDQRHSV